MTQWVQIPWREGGLSQHSPSGLSVTQPCVHLDTYQGRFALEGEQVKQEVPDSTMWQILCVWQQTQPGVISAWQSWHSLSCWEQPVPGLCCRDLTLTQTKQRLSRHQLLNKAPHSDYLHISSVLSQPETERVAGRLQGDVGGQIFTPASTKAKAQTSQSFLRLFLFQFPHHFEKNLSFLYHSQHQIHSNAAGHIYKLRQCLWFLFALRCWPWDMKISAPVSSPVWFPFPHGELGPSRKGCAGTKQHPSFYSEHWVLKILQKMDLSKTASAKPEIFPFPTTQEQREENLTLQFLKLI